MWRIGQSAGRERVGAKQVGEFIVNQRFRNWNIGE